MLKRFALILCLILLPCLLLAACGGEETTGEATEAQTEAQTAPGTEPATEGETLPATTEGGVCTVVFSIDGRETAIEVPRGEIPVCPEELLSWETAENFCKVTGWDKEIVPAESDETYVATVGRYGLTVYNVRFVLGNGVLKVEAHEGETPTPPAGYETDLSKVDRIGTFVRWSPELVAPTAENTKNGTKALVFSAVYSYNTRYYTVTFVVKGTEYPVRVAGNKLPVCPVDPAADEEDLTVGFKGWDKEVVAVTEDTVYNAVYGNSASLYPAKDGAKGVLTMTYDDGIFTTARWVNKENKKYGLKGSCMMVPNFGGTKPDFNDKVSDWAAIFADGTLEPESHSMTHDLVLPSERWGSYEGSKYNNIQENYDVELVQSKAYIEAAFPGHAVLCFAPSNNTLSTYSFKSDGNGNLVNGADGNPVVVEDGGAQAVANATYYAIRQGQRGYQSLDPAFGSEPGGWGNLYMQSFRSTTDQDEKLALGKEYLDNAVNTGTWLIIMCHGIIGDGATSGSGDIGTEAADKFFAYAGEYVSTGELWSATFGEATKYIRERQNTTVSERYENGVVYLDMKINRTTEDGLPLDASVFNYPLTVKVRVPANWKTAGYTVDGAAKTAKTFVDAEDGQTYVKVNLIPGADGVTASTAFTFVN